MKTKTILLIISLIAFAAGFSAGADSIFLQLGLPLGAILLGLSLIFGILEKESALLDQQNESNPAQKSSRESNRKIVENKMPAHYPSTIRKGAAM